VNYDCIIIGGGISGLTAGIKCVHEGLSCAIISSGMSALHFSSGSIDMLGYTDNGDVIYEPHKYIDEFIDSHKSHPYAKCGRDMVADSLQFFQDQVANRNVEFFHNNSSNHFHVTALGTLKPTYLSQRSVFNEKVRNGFANKPSIAIINFEGFRDFHPELAASNLKRNQLFNDFEIFARTIQLSEFNNTNKNPHEFRSIDIARILEKDKNIERIASQIKEAAGNALFAGIPALLGIHDSERVHRKLEELTGLIIYEIPTLPPSILGMRIDDALKTIFADAGGVFIAGDKVISGEIDNNILTHIHTQNYGKAHLTAHHYILSTGSFFSGGMVSEFDSIHEPVFGLQLDYPKGRSNWYSQNFFDRKSHPFLHYGVDTDNNLRPRDKNGDTIQNLYCTGAILANYDPIREGSGGGVAISTAYFAARQIIEKCKE